MPTSSDTEYTNLLALFRAELKKLHTMPPTPTATHTTTHKATKRTRNVAKSALTSAGSNLMFLAAVEPASSPPPIPNPAPDLPPSPAASMTTMTTSAAVSTPTPEPTVLQPLASLSQDGVLAQIEHWSGCSITRVPNKEGRPHGFIQIPEEQVSALFALCQYKRQFEENLRRTALAAVRAEVQVDRSRFLDLKEFQTEIPDLEVTEFEAISKRAPSAATRAKNLDAAVKMSNTKRLQRMRADSPTKTDVPVFRAAITALRDDSVLLSIDADGVMEFMPVGVSLEACTAVLDYLARNNVIGFSGKVGDRVYHMNETSEDRLNALIATLRPGAEPAAPAPSRGRPSTRK